MRGRDYLAAIALGVVAGFIGATTAVPSIKRDAYVDGYRDGQACEIRNQISRDAVRRAEAFHGLRAGTVPALTFVCEADR